MHPEDLAAFARRHGLDALATAELRALMETTADQSTAELLLTDETTGGDTTLVGLLPDQFGDVLNEVVDTELVDKELAAALAQQPPKKKADLSPQPLPLGTRPTPAPIPPPPDRPLPADSVERYEDRGRIARGGMGEVRRAYDRLLQRTVAMKTLHMNRADRLSAHRFLREAVVTAQLQHPVIVPIYDLGQRPDGTRFYTMREVSGETLSDLIDAVHAAHSTAWRTTGHGWSLHRLARALARVSEAVAFAHAHGAVHRDLKPDNVMVGEFGDVQLLDWGLVKVVGEGVESPQDADAHTRIGSITGTPAYMAPEQARGALDQIGPATDVYGLGALLYCILTGKAPYKGDLATVLLALAEAQLPSPVSRTSKPLPPELVSLCQEAMAGEPQDRISAQAFTERLDRWLDGSQKQQEAARLVDAARPLLRSARVLEQRARALGKEAVAKLEALPDWASETRKAKAWALEEQATLQARDALKVELMARRKLAQAIVHDANCVDAHDLLAVRYRHDHAMAEEAGDEVLAERALDQLRYHVGALPGSLADDHQAYLKGDGVLVVRSQPPGARATLYRYERKHRRYVAVKDRELGVTPVEVKLPMGRYLVKLDAPRHHSTRWPVRIMRNGRVDNVPPQGHDPAPVLLLPKGQVGSEDQYVPAGWMMAGDRRCDTAAPPRRVWVDGFVISRFPVTVSEYIVFLNALIELGREDEAERYQPRRGIGGRPWLLRDETGFRPDPEGLLSVLELPVVGVDQASARAFLAWLSSRTGQTWRLPTELEWEKAARGVDGRLYPWGELFDPTWARVRASSRTRPVPDVVDSYPVDTSPYGVRGMGGNVSEWCMDPWKASGPHVQDGRAVVPSVEDIGGPSVVRGGHWLALATGAQVPGRRRAERDQVSRIVGFRRVRSL